MITDRIAKFLETGIVEIKPIVQQIKSNSKFNWKTEELTKETLLTDSYKNTENVRQFFKKHIGSHFHFTTTFMKWMKKNSGKNLQNAANEWIKLNELSKDKSIKTKIAPQFEYNSFIRDFLKVNPDMSLIDTIKQWKRIHYEKRSNKYSKS